MTFKDVFKVNDNTEEIFYTIYFSRSMLLFNTGTKKKTFKVLLNVKNTEL